ncbi:MAG: YraN family protein [Patescibacteria group bacterium]|jgi:putative endonuclease
MKHLNYSKGRLGENLAKNYLIKKGFKPLDQNYRTPHGEIDLIMLDGPTLVFIEVKLKIGTDFGLPEDMISKNKIIQVQKTARRYLLDNPLGFPRLRLDAVCIVLDSDKSVKRIAHYENLSN